LETLAKQAHEFLRGRRTTELAEDLHERLLDFWAQGRCGHATPFSHATKQGYLLAVYLATGGSVHWERVDRPIS